MCVYTYIHTFTYIHTYTTCLCVREREREKIIYIHTQATRVFTLAAGTARALAALLVNATRTSSTRHEPGR
jgi:hypothetical protein